MVHCEIQGAWGEGEEGWGREGEGVVTADVYVNCRWGWGDVSYRRTFP